MTKLNIEIFADNEIVFCKGQNLVNRNRVSVKKVSENENSYDAKVYDADACYLVNFSLVDDQISTFLCSCNAKKPCHHLIAGLIKHSDQEYKINKMHLNTLAKSAPAVSHNLVKQEEWAKGEIFFSILDNVRYEDRTIIQLRPKILSDKERIVIPICDDEIFKDAHDKNDPRLLFKQTNGPTYNINADAFELIDMEILEFLILHRMDLSESKSSTLRNYEADTFWIDYATLKNLTSTLIAKYQLKDIRELKEYLDENSFAFRIAMFEDAQRVLFSKIKSDKYEVFLQTKAKDKRWQVIKEMDVDAQQRLVWVDPKIQLWRNKQNYKIVSFFEASMPECCMYYHARGITRFEYTDDNKTVNDLFDRFPRTLIRLSYGSKRRSLTHWIKYEYPGDEPFVVLSSDDHPQTNKKRLFIYEKAVINALVDTQLKTRKWFLRNKKINNLKISDLRAIAESHKSFNQSPIVQYDLSENLTNERVIEFDLNRFEAIKFEDKNLVIKNSDFDFSIKELKILLDDYLQGKEIYIGTKCFYDLTKPKNQAFCEFWSKFDFYNANSPSPGVYVFPRFRVFDLYQAFDCNIDLIRKYASKEIYDLVSSLLTAKLKSVEVPSSFKKILRPYQVEGYQWMKTLQNYGFGGVLADDMGLGKTIQMISVLYETHMNDDSLPSLVIAPTSLIYNWDVECQKFAPDMKVTIIQGTSSEREKLIKANQKGLEITSYALFRRDIEFYKNKKYRFVVVDEAQNIKNHHTNLSSAVKKIYAEHRFALTGTPLVNNVVELWSILDFVIPGLFGSSHDFAKDYEKVIVKNNDEKLVERLKQKVNSFILRRTKQKVLTELPLKTQKDLVIDLAPEHRKFYDKWFEHSRASLKSLISENAAAKVNNQKAIRLNVLRLITELRQICCSPLIKDSEFIGQNTKLETCLELIEQAIANKRKVLIFTQFLGMIEILETELKKRKIKHFILSGSTPKSKRVEMVNKFNKDDTPVFIATLQTGGVGLNLVGAEIVIHYDLWWNLAVQNQATDRVHRIGQTKPVNVYRIIVNDSIEQRIVDAQEKKRKMIKDIIEDNENGISLLPLDVMVELFNLKLPETEN